MSTLCIFHFVKNPHISIENCSFTVKTADLHLKNVDLHSNAQISVKSADLIEIHISVWAFNRETS